MIVNDDDIKKGDVFINIHTNKKVKVISICDYIDEFVHNLIVFKNSNGEDIALTYVDFMGTHKKHLKKVKLNKTMVKNCKSFCENFESDLHKWAEIIRKSK